MQATVKPNNHPQYSAIENAMIECWVRCPTETEALAIVRHTITSDNWAITLVEGPEIHTEDDYVGEPEFLRYYKQAQTDGEVFIYHIPPNDRAG